MKNYLGKTKKQKEVMARTVEAEAPPGHMLSYITPEEAGILKLLGGTGDINPVTGIPQFPQYGGATGKSDEDEQATAYGYQTDDPSQGYQTSQDAGGGGEEAWTSQGAENVANIVAAMANNEQLQADIGAEEAKKAAKVVKTTEKKVIPEKVIPEEVTTPFFKGFGKVTPQQLRIINKLRKQGKNDATILMALRQGKFADENLVDLKSGEGIKRLLTKTIPDEDKYEHEFLGSAGAAAILKKINKAGTEGEKQKIMHDAIAANPEGFNDMFSDYTGGYEDLTPEDFKRVLTDYNAGNKNFDRVMDPDSYYALHPPQTTGEMERMLGSGITMTKENTQMIQDARDRVSESQGQGGGIGGLGGGGGALPPVTDPTPDPTKVPDYVLKQQYMPGFTPDYSGGAEQMQIAGGYWDPITKKWIGSPWGTQGQYQFNQGGIVGTNPLLFKNKGGMVNDGGIKSFKKYGY